jgi:hypothetical protein
MKNRSILVIAVLVLYQAIIYSQEFSQLMPQKEITDAVDTEYHQSSDSLPDNESPGEVTDYSPVISRISVLSIHVRDTLVHDSVFHFLTDRLGLPVEYYPEKWIDRKYAGVYAGNMFLEPCGPYTNFSYASNDFRAIFFGLNCESERSLSSLEEDLSGRDIKIQQDGTIQIIDTTIIRQNIFLSIASGQLQNKVNEDSLRLLMVNNKRNVLGIEGIKEIRVGYTNKVCLARWERLILPSVISDAGLWKVNDSQSVRFVKSRIAEVNAIVFKVKSLEKAKNWLTANKLSGDISGDEIALDKSKTFGLLIFLSEKDQ